MWGEDVVGWDKSDPTTADFRQRAKIGTHGWSYGGGPQGLANQLGATYQQMKEFTDGMSRAYRDLVRWQNKIRREAKRGFVVSDWGRRMLVDRKREYTQGPALVGQNITREIVCDSVIEFPYEISSTIVGQVHDALVFDWPVKKAEKYLEITLKIMTKKWKPKEGGMEMDFPVSAGPFARNWLEASHVS